MGIFYSFSFIISNIFHSLLIDFILLEISSVNIIYYYYSFLLYISKGILKTIKSLKTRTVSLSLRHLLFFHSRLIAPQVHENEKKVKRESSSGSRER